ncbi:MAG: hypothetical protein ACRBN8_30430 [Nannocystales bacterium]
MNLDKYLTAPFNQSGVLRKAVETDPSLKGTHASKGICQELCWKWLKRLSTQAVRYDSPEARMDSLALERTVGKAMDRHNGADLMTFTHKQYKLEGVDCYLSYRRDVQSKWRVKGGGLYFAFTCPRYGNGKHAVAAYLFRVEGQRQTRSSVLVFEPNRGEFKMEAGMFPIWLRETLRSYGGTEEDVREIRFLDA